MLNFTYSIKTNVHFTVAKEGDLYAARFAVPGDRVRRYHRHAEPEAEDQGQKAENVPVRRHSDRHAGSRFLIGTVMPNSEYNQPERFGRMSTQKSEI